MDKRTEPRRIDPWGDFLRRVLLSASIAGTALPAAATEEGPAVEVVEPEQPAPTTTPAQATTAAKPGETRSAEG